MPTVISAVEQRMRMVKSKWNLRKLKGTDEPENIAVIGER